MSKQEFDQNMQYTHYLIINLTIALLITGCVSTSTEVFNSTHNKSKVQKELSSPTAANIVIFEEQIKMGSKISTLVAEPGVPFELGYKEMVRLGDSNFDLTFEAIIQDGRCPIGGACVWQGEAEVQFLLASGNMINKVFTLKIPGLPKASHLNHSFVEQAGFRFQLLQLEPYPSDEEPTQLSEYRACLLFERF